MRKIKEAPRERSQPLTPVEIRIEALMIAMLPQDIPANYDAGFYLERARAFEAYIVGPLAMKPQAVVKPATADKFRPETPPKQEG